MSRSFGGSDKLQGTSALASGAHTLMVWCKPASLANFKDLLKVRNNSGEGQVTKLTSMGTGNIRYQIDQGANSSQIDLSGTGTGTWVSVFGKSNGSNAHKVFIDGASQTGSTASSPTGLAEVLVGDGFTGLIAHAAIWNIALSDSDIALLAAGANPLTIQNANLVGYWPLADTGGTETDAAGANDLTVTGATHSTDDPTVDAPPSGPAAPTDLAVVSVTASAVNLSWTDNASDEDSFVIQYDTDNTFPSPIEIVLDTADTESAEIEPLAGGTLYYARVKARNEGGDSDWSNTVSFTTDTTTPAAITGLVGRNESSGVVLEWAADPAAETYNVYRANTPSNQDPPAGGTLIGSSGTTTFTDTTAVAGNTYWYSVSGVNSSDVEGDRSPEISVTRSTAVGRRRLRMKTRPRRRY